MRQLAGRVSAHRPAGRGGRLLCALHGRLSACGPCASSGRTRSAAAGRRRRRPVRRRRSARGCGWSLCCCTDRASSPPAPPTVPPNQRRSARAPPQALAGPASPHRTTPPARPTDRPYPAPLLPCSARQRRRGGGWWMAGCGWSGPSSCCGDAQSCWPRERPHHRLRVALVPDAPPSRRGRSGVPRRHAALPRPADPGNPPAGVALPHPDGGMPVRVRTASSACLSLKETAGAGCGRGRRGGRREPDPSLIEPVGPRVDKSALNRRAPRTSPGSLQLRGTPMQVTRVMGLARRRVRVRSRARAPPPTYVACAGARRTVHRSQTRCPLAHTGGLTISPLSRVTHTTAAAK